MILSQELAQRCADKIMKNLGHNINIMNKQGIIIASGNKERIGTYHIIAEKAVRKKRRIDVYKGDAEKYKGVKEGINMPFFYRNMVIGVIGITGNPNSLVKTAKIVKMAVELMIEQELAKEQRYIHSNQIKVLVNKILEATSVEDFYDLTQLASKLGYDLKIPRVPCLLTTENMDNTDIASITSTLKQIKYTLLKEIELLDNSSIQDIICDIDINKILILKTVNNTNDINMKNYILEFYIQLKDKIKSELGKDIYFAVGSLHENPLDIKESYEEAIFILNFLQKSGSNKRIAFIEDYMIEYLCTKLPSKYLDHFLLNYVEKIEGKEELINTIKSLVMNNMNIKKAAEDLYVHRNTIIFRVNKIKELLNIDPFHNDTDRILLRLLYYYISINSF